jgi:predicted ATP-dependent protease
MTPRNDQPDAATPTSDNAASALPVDALRWRCDPAALGFRTTGDVDPIHTVIGQDSAVESLQFGLETDARGQNVFVRGLEGTGRMTLVRQLFNEIKPSCSSVYDYCYVHNFEDPNCPSLIRLPQGRGRQFRKMVDALIEFIRSDLRGALSSEDMQRRREAIDERAERLIAQITDPFDQLLRSHGLALVSVTAGAATQLGIFPLIDDKPIPPEEFEQLRASGAINDQDYAALRERFESHKEKFQEIGQKVQQIRDDQMNAVHLLYRTAARTTLELHVTRIEKESNSTDVTRFIRAVVDDVVEHRLRGIDEDTDFVDLYRVNVIRERTRGESCPIVIENVPTVTSLLGSIDAQLGPGGVVRSDHTMINAGSLLRADGGYLILEASDVISEPGAWKMLMRTLRTGRLEIVPREFAGAMMGRTIKPEPIELDVKVILLGDAYTYHLLDSADPDFANMFKVLADFDQEIRRDERGIAQYAGVLTRIIREEELPEFDAAAVAELVEHGARVVSRGNRLTARFGRLADIAREAAFLCRKNGTTVVTGETVREAVRRTKRRGDLPARRFRELVAERTIIVETRGEAVGQINGLAVLQAGPLTYGFPARISATVGPGGAGIINVDREAALSGAIHTKGFLILHGLLRRLLCAHHPPAFSASVVFEQSYGMIDGDSASGAEICCLLSALTGKPLRQDLAMTGAIDQFGHILAIGGVNEKIEGFYDACCDAGLTGTQGVVIPKANAAELMLRHDVVDAAEQGRFAIHAVSTLGEALELFTGMPAGEQDASGEYPEGTLLRCAVDESKTYWERAIKAGQAAREG